MKKQIFLIISLFVAYYSYGQTHSICKDAFYITSDFETIGDEQKTYWLYFTSKSDFLSIYLDKAPNDVSCYLYAGDCENLNLLEQSNFNFLSYYKLNIGEKYFVKIESDKILEKVDIYFSNQSNDDMVSIASMCEEVESCDKIANGDFSQTIGEIDYTNPFSSGNIQGWATLTTHVTAFLEGDNSIYIKSSNWYNQSIVTCTNLSEEQMYLLQFDYNSDFLQGLDYIKIGVSTSAIDNYQGVQQITNIPENIFQDIASVSPYDNDHWHTYNGVFQPIQNSSRLFVYGVSIPSTGFWFDNISVTPIDYTTYTSCGETEITPSCPIEVDVLDGFSINWEVISGSADIVEGGHSLTPTVEVETDAQIAIIIRNTETGEMYHDIAQINYSAPPFKVYPTITNATCDNSLGSISVNVVNAQPPISYFWTDNQGNPIGNTSLLEGLEVGTYSLKVKDANGCIVYEQYEIIHAGGNLDLESDVQVIGDNQNCCAIASVIANNGQAPYTYNWSGSNNYSSTLPTNTDLCNGTYSVQVKDTNNCIGEIEFNIEGGEPCPPCLSPIFLCNNTALTLTAQGENPVWSTGAIGQSITVTEPGIYTYTNQLSNGCNSCVNGYYVSNQNDFTIEVYTDNCDQQQKYYNLQAPSGFDTYHWSIECFDVNDNLVAVNDLIQLDCNVLHPSEVMDITGNTIEALCSPRGFANAEYFVVSCFVEGQFCNYTDQVVLFSGVPVYGKIRVQNNIIQHYNEQTQTYEPNPYLGSAEEFFDGNNLILTDDLEIINSNFSIDDAYIEVRAGKKIIIEASSHISLNHTKIKKDNCEDLSWKGIVLKGHPYAGYNSIDQSMLHIVNGSLISGADVGVKITNGARFFAHNSKFTNNTIALQFEETYQTYVTHNSITDCLFETNQGILSIANLEPECFINLDKYSFVLYVQDCEFRNAVLNTPLLERGKGIVSDKSNLIVRNNCSFSYLNKAIDAYNYSSVQIKDNTFKDNYQSVHLNSLQNALVKNNTFNDALSMPYENAFQLCAEACTNPQIRLNHFKNGVAGLVLKDNGVDNFKVYKNTFEGFTNYNNSLSGYPSGIVTMGINGFYEDCQTISGAEIKCNQFSNYDYAIALMSGVLRTKQGTFNTLYPIAANTFENALQPEGRFFISAEATTHYQTSSGSSSDNRIRYRYYQPGLNNAMKLVNGQYTATFPNGALYRIIPSQPQSATNQLILNNYTKVCPNEETSSTSSYGLAPTVQTLNQAIDLQAERISSKTDGGNTELLLNRIATTNVNQYQDLLSELDSIGDYLSPLTAHALMEKESPEPIEQTIALISVSPLPESAKEDIDNLPLDATLKAWVKSYQNGKASREQDLEQLQHLKEAKEQSFKDFYKQEIIDQLNDSIRNIKQKEYLNILSAQKEWKFQKEAMINYWQQGDMEKALALLDEAESYSQEADEEELNFWRFNCQLDTLPADEKQVLVQSREDWINDLMQSDIPYLREGGKYLLHKYRGIDPIVRVALPHPEKRSVSRSQLSYNTTEAFKVPSTAFLQIAPNPVQNHLTVHFIMPPKQTLTALVISNLKGQVISVYKINKAYGVEQLDLSQLPAGTYFLSMEQANNKLKTEKFIKL